MNIEPGHVWAWGDNAHGQLGDGTTTHRGTPERVEGLSEVKTIGVGGGHTLALRADGTVWAWGRNDFGQVGDGTFDNATRPTQVEGLSEVAEVCSSGGHNMALLPDGTVRAWGHNLRGDVGDGTTEHRNVPVQVVGLEGVTQLAWGGGHSLALREDGTVWAWGHNLFGGLGDGTTTTRLTAVQVKDLTDVAVVFGGGGHSMAIKSDGTVWAWGRNDRGQLGDGTTEPRLTPIQIEVSDEAKVQTLAPGFFHTLALLSDGTVWAWGNNDSGQIGDGTTANQATPLPVAGVAAATAIAAGGGRNEFGPGGHSLALGGDGTIYAWGLNDAGQLGDGTTTNRPAPTAVPGVKGPRQVVAGGGFSVVLG
jgi:alpha-tubulin suppressor-like RCC1 family protein